MSYDEIYSVWMFNLNGFWRLVWKWMGMLIVWNGFENLSSNNFKVKFKWFWNSIEMVSRFTYESEDGMKRDQK